jgi:hypothetical protein
MQPWREDYERALKAKAAADRQAAEAAEAERQAKDLMRKKETAARNAVIRPQALAILDQLNASDSLRAIRDTVWMCGSMKLTQTDTLTGYALAHKYPERFEIIRHIETQGDRGPLYFEEHTGEFSTREAEVYLQIAVEHRNYTNNQIKVVTVSTNTGTPWNGLDDKIQIPSCVYSDAFNGSPSVFYLRILDCNNAREQLNIMLGVYAKFTPKLWIEPPKRPGWFQRLLGQI